MFLVKFLLKASTLTEEKLSVKRVMKIDTIKAKICFIIISPKIIIFILT